MKNFILFLFQSMTLFSITFVAVLIYLGITANVKTIAIYYTAGFVVLTILLGLFITYRKWK